ncbi:hypothetical protein HHL28_13610 [Aerophototrophica crusticola]|uniref:Uncharacterized protein n=1 Tax=Aerophototrophica crusticola TaxID=1709002 RepID=A0A858R9E8_9PROT|nr:hypothetical protein HHL28_13610 [Rhodospirillaceae bacterium B3]
MVIDMRTRLPYGHLASHAATMRFHAEQLRRCAQQLQAVMADLQALDVGPLLEAAAPRD